MMCKCLGKYSKLQGFHTTWKTLRMPIHLEISLNFLVFNKNQGNVGKWSRPQILDFCFLEFCESGKRSTKMKNGILRKLRFKCEISEWYDGPLDTEPKTMADLGGGGGALLPTDQLFLDFMQFLVTFDEIVFLRDPGSVTVRFMGLSRLTNKGPRDFVALYMQRADVHLSLRKSSYKIVPTDSNLQSSSQIDLFFVRHAVHRPQDIKILWALQIGRIFF